MRLGQVEEVKVIHADGTEGTAKLLCVGVAQSTGGQQGGTVQGQDEPTP